MSRLMGLWLGACVISFALGSMAVAGDVAIVANADVKDAEVALVDLKNMYLGQKGEWADGAKVTLGCLKEGASHEAFLKEVAEKTSQQFFMHWKKLVFAGKGVEPRIFATEKELLAFVAATKGAVGYVGSAVAADSSALTGCKVIAVK